ncbi:MAG TPA: EAL domain-containing protein [Armatimonadota bacterium]
MIHPPSLRSSGQKMRRQEHLGRPLVRLLVANTLLSLLMTLCTIYLLHTLVQNLSLRYMLLLDSALLAALCIPIIYWLLFRPLLEQASQRLQAERALQVSEREFREMLENVHLLAVTLDTEGAITFCNDFLLESTGWQREDVLGRNWFDLFIPPDEREAVRQLFQEAVRQGTIPTHYEYCILTRDGVKRYVSWNNSLQHAPDDRVTKATSIGEDITERKAVEERSRLAATVLDNTMEGVAVLNARGQIHSVNPAFTTITGFSAAEVIDRPCSLLFSDRHARGFFLGIWRALRNTHQWEGEIWGRRQNGEAYLAWVAITTIQDVAGRMLHCIITFNDITRLKRHAALLEHQAYHDALTGLPNRALFHDRLELALAHARRENAALAVMFLDLDHFKGINDTLGHFVGDQLLQETSARLVRCVRKADTVARLGGDEFTLLLPEINQPEDAALVARKVLEACSEPYLVGEQAILVTPSIGISIYPHDGKHAEALLHSADIAMYRTKMQGRNGYNLYSTTDLAETERGDLDDELADALERREFVLHYQPQFDLRSGWLSGVEAFIRWQHRSLGLLPPTAFLPAVEESGLIVPLGEWILQTACAQYKRWMDAGRHPGRLTVNLSLRQVLHRDLAATVQRALADSGLSPRYLALDIHESLTTRGTDRSADTLEELHRLGVRLAMDDYGSGLSSLARLRQYPIHALKLDRTVVNNLPRHADAVAIASAAIALAHGLNLTIIAEGAETLEQLDFLRAQRCDEAQGFLLGHPLPADEFSATFLATPTAQSARLHD